MNKFEKIVHKTAMSTEASARVRRGGNLSGHDLRTVREALKMSQAEFARALGFSDAGERFIRR